MSEARGEGDVLLRRTARSARERRSTPSDLRVERHFPARPSIDATGHEPGTYEMTPAVDLPADVELVKQEPGSVELRILRQKRKADGQ